MAAGNRTVALQLASAAAAHQAVAGAGLGSILNADEGRSRREYVSGDEDERTWASGAAMSIEQAVAMALEEKG